MKKLFLASVTILVASMCFAQISKRMPLPQLKFNDKGQQEIFDNVSSHYNANEELGFEFEWLAPHWEGHQNERMGLAFLQYLVYDKDSFEDMHASKDAVAVGKALLDWYMGQKGKKVPASYPYNYKAYKACLEGFMAPVRDAMCDGSQMEMNSYANMDGDMCQFLGMLKQYLVSSRFRSSNLKAALDAENEAWLKLRNNVSNLFYQYKVDINGGIGYSLLPLEIAGMLDYADKVRDSSLSVLYAFSAENPGAVYALGKEDLSEVQATFKKEMAEVKTDASSFHKAWNNFLEKRKEVGELLPESQKEMFKWDTNRYFRILTRLISSEDEI